MRWGMVEVQVPLVHYQGDLASLCGANGPIVGDRRVVTCEICLRMMG